MIRSKVARTALCVMPLAVLGGFASSASASDASIKKVIKTYNPKILVAEGHVISAIGEFRKNSNAGPVESALTASINVFKSLKSKIAGQPAVSPNVKKGKLKLLKGLTAVISAYQHLKVAFAIKAVSQAAATEQALKAETAVHKGRKELHEGLQLLK